MIFIPRNSHLFLRYYKVINSLHIDRVDSLNVSIIGNLEADRVHMHAMDVYVVDSAGWKDREILLRLLKALEILVSEIYPV